MSISQIDYDVPLPGIRVCAFARQLMDLPPGASFMVQTERERNNALTIAHRHGVAIITSGEEKGGYRIWKKGPGAPLNTRRGRPKLITP